MCDQSLLTPSCVFFMCVRITWNSVIVTYVWYGRYAVVLALLAVPASNTLLWISATKIGQKILYELIRV